ncbi:PaaI family thioesterase [Neobacillus mesonae]|uniref:PaaI family thioesterase n=1 Tax=Neobacillus mesonae TaxID=1193713 RepID=UPI00203F3E6C|nr:PaaI family thioesterase [Neobacillus mesonae]MCM3566523.1 PaaI family thioesterase [Neobacillus mesonae]
MGSPNTDFNLMEVVSKKIQPPNCDLTLQIEVTDADNGNAKGTWRVDDRFLNGIGITMGGFVSSAADIMMAYAIASKLDNGKTFTSIDLHTTFHRPVLPGEVTVEAKVERMGKRTAYLTAELIQNDKKTASVVSSVMILDR